MRSDDAEGAARARRGALVQKATDEVAKVPAPDGNGAGGNGGGNGNKPSNSPGRA